MKKYEDNLQNDDVEKFIVMNFFFVLFYSLYFCVMDVFFCINIKFDGIVFFLLEFVGKSFLDYFMIFICEFGIVQLNVDF